MTSSEDAWALKHVDATDALLLAMKGLRATITAIDPLANVESTDQLEDTITQLRACSIDLGIAVRMWQKAEPHPNPNKREHFAAGIAHWGEAAAALTAVKVGCVHCHHCLTQIAAALARYDEAANAAGVEFALAGRVE